MPIRSKTTTDLFSDTIATFPPASIVSYQIANYPAQVEINVPSDSSGGYRGEDWRPLGRALPGFWTAKTDDFTRFGGSKSTGIRFKSDVSGYPAVVDVSN